MIPDPPVIPFDNHFRNYYVDQYSCVSATEAMLIYFGLLQSPEEREIKRRAEWLEIMQLTDKGMKMGDAIKKVKEIH